MTADLEAALDEQVVRPFVGHRPYARIRGSEPSVTTILDVLAKPGLSWGAAAETAVFAVLHPDKWQTLPEKEGVERLRKHHRGIWDGRAAMGTLCHGVNELFCQGIDVDAEAVDRMVSRTIATDRNARTWPERDRSELLEDVFGYVLGLEQFWADFSPVPTASEQVVRSPGIYIGQTDMRAVIHGQDWLLDLKTTAKQDEHKGIYLDSWTFQLAAYGFATETVSYGVVPDRKLKDGERVVEIHSGPWSPPERFGVVHLRGDESYSFFEIPADKQVHELFCALADLHAFVKRLGEDPVRILPRGNR